MRRWPACAATACCLLAVAGTPLTASADGGVVVARGRVGHLDCTVLVAPAPLRAGRAEWSILLRDPETAEVVLDAEVELELRRARAGTGPGLQRATATRAASDNRLLYSARIELPQPGSWQAVARVRRAGGEARFGFEVAVAPALGALREHWRALALPPLALGLFALHQWLVLASGARRRQRG